MTLSSVVPPRAVAALILLNCVACATVEKPPADVRLLEAQRVLDEGKELRELGKYAEALKLIERAWKLREAVHGGRHLEVAECLHLLGVLHRSLGDYAKSEQFLQRALTIREAALGGNHPAVATSLFGLANLYVNQGHYERAEALYERTLAIRETALGQDHPEVAFVLNNFANLHFKQGHYVRAESLYSRALAIREKVLGQKHPLFAHSLSGLGTLYKEQGDLARARPLYERALAILEEALGKDHPDLATVLNNLANLFEEQGKYLRAESLYERSLEILKAALGENHPHVANLINNLANLYDTWGRYAEAEPLYVRALGIWEASLGKNHPDLILSLNNLAILYINQGDYARAEPLFERALGISEEALGESHLDVALALNNLANLSLTQGDHVRAEPLYARARAIREAVLGKSHPLVATSLHNLASLHEAQGDDARAEPLYERSLEISESALGKNHPANAPTLQRLADLYLRQGNFVRAESLYQRALAIQEAALDKNHPEVAGSLTRLAHLYLAQEHLPQALPLLERAFIIYEKHLRQEAFGFSESRLANVLDLLRADEERLYTLLGKYPDDTRVRRLALATALLRKGRSVEELAETSRIVYRELGEADREALHRLRALRARRAALSFADSDTLALAEYQQRLQRLVDEADTLEADLTRRSAHLRALSLPPSTELVDVVATAVPSDGVLIELVAYRSNSSVFTPDVRSSGSLGELHYLALLLGADGRTSAIDLGPAAPIDRAALRLREALARSDFSYLPIAQDLYRRAFRPLEPFLGKVRRLFLSPDGQLALVPFAALHNGHGFLIDDFDIIYLTSGKDLLPRSKGIDPARTVVVLADPDFDTPPGAGSRATETEPWPIGRSAVLERFFSTWRSGSTERPWPPLPGTRQEARSIQRMLPQARVLMGRAATKEALLTLETPGVLHIATHGFFKGDEGALVGTRTPGNFGALAEAGPSHPDPLLRSGLVLAGAHASERQQGAFPHEESLVTALELAGLNLWGTQLVVLSACDTGRGDVKPGQGVYGLRRALVVAGAQTLVTSLWRVNDKTTRQLMESYYRNLLAGQGRAVALRSAMKALRRKQPHPSFWAPFIAIGQDTPLQGVSPQAGLQPTP